MVKDASKTFDEPFFIHVTLTLQRRNVKILDGNTPKIKLKSKISKTTPIFLRSIYRIRILAVLEFLIGDFRMWVKIAVFHSLLS